MECLPAGPSAETVWPEMLIFTFSGRSIGFLPSRDICLPNLADQFAAYALLARLAVAHDSLGGRQDLDAQAVHDSPEAVNASEDAAARFGHPLDLRDDRFAVGIVLQVQVQGLALRLFLVLNGLHVLEVALGPEHLRHSFLQDGVRQAEALVTPPVGVLDHGEHVADRIRAGHFLYPLTVLPRSFPDPRNLRPVRQHPEAEAADLELAMVRATASADRAAIVGSSREFRLPLLLDLPADARHTPTILSSSGGTAPRAFSGAQGNRPNGAPSRRS